MVGDALPGGKGFREGEHGAGLEEEGAGDRDATGGGGEGVAVGGVGVEVLTPDGAVRVEVLEEEEVLVPGGEFDACGFVEEAVLLQGVYEEGGYAGPGFWGVGVGAYGPAEDYR